MKTYLAANVKTTHATWNANSRKHNFLSVVLPKTRKNNVTKFMLYRVSVALDGLNKPVCVSNLGSRCRGHGTSLNNCGIEYKKFTTCGKQNNNNVSEKWPKMPATAKVIPAKYVYESPTNTALGYQFCFNKPTVAAKNGAINNNENRNRTRNCSENLVS